MQNGVFGFLRDIRSFDSDELRQPVRRWHRFSRTVRSG